LHLLCKLRTKVRSKKSNFNQLNYNKRNKYVKQLMKTANEIPILDHFDYDRLCKKVVIGNKIMLKAQLFSCSLAGLVDIRLFERC